MARKKLSFFNRIIFLFNTLFAVGLALSLLLPNLPPESYGIISLLSLLVPPLIIGNLFFILYWIFLGFKKQLFQSFTVLLIAYFIMPVLYKFTGSEGSSTAKKISILTYNVRKFNSNQWLDIDAVDAKIDSFISQQDPDIIALQEYRISDKFTLDYPYAYNSFMNTKARSGLVIFSKFPILDSGTIKHRGFGHNPIYVDLKKDSDTLRIYNFHLASLGLNADQENFGYDDSEKLIKRVSRAFKIQQKQITVLNEHVKQSKFKTIIAGDMNNTAYSWAYKHLKNEFQDTFTEAGKRSGKTFSLKGFPLRIDYIFADKSLRVVQHKNYKIKLSDHFPVMATIEIP